MAEGPGVVDGVAVVPPLPPSLESPSPGPVLGKGCEENLGVVVGVGKAVGDVEGVTLGVADTEGVGLVDDVAVAVDEGAGD